VVKEPGSRRRPPGPNPWSIGQYPILWHIMKICGAYGINDFVICLGYKGYMIKEYFQNYPIHSCDLRIDLKTRQTSILSCGTEPWSITLVDTASKP
jgi:glucose-1-phosphate cytidylyltransferase